MVTVILIETNESCDKYVTGTMFRLTRGGGGGGRGVQGGGSPLPPPDRGTEEVFPQAQIAEWKLKEVLVLEFSGMGQIQNRQREGGELFVNVLEERIC